MLRKMSSFWDILFGKEKRKKNESGKKYFTAKKGVTPTFWLISENLEDDKEQVFEAAVYYLCVIAKMKKEYQQDILNIFDAYLKRNKLQPIREAYVRDMLKKYGFLEFIHN